MKKKAFPNEYFVTQQAYWEFCDKHQVWGKEALELRKKLTKEIIPMPRIKPTKGENQL